MTNKETELFHFPEVMVHPENLDAWRLEIGGIREEKGRELETLRKIHRVFPVAMANQEYEHATYFQLEEARVWRHVFMRERDEEFSDEQGKRKAADKMQRAVSKAERLVRRHDLDQVRSEIHRFRGSVANTKGNYKDALMEYELALLWFDKSKDAEVNPARRYEYEGYVAEHLIRTGEVREGIKKAGQAYWSLINTEEGKALRQKDYYTWAVWASGIVIHESQALLDTLDRQEALKYIDYIERRMDKAEDLLVVPRGATWTKAEYEIRKDEIQAVRRVCNRLGSNSF